MNEVNFRLWVFRTSFVGLVWFASSKEESNHGGKDFATNEHQNGHDNELGIRENLHFYGGHTGNGGGRNGGEEQI